MSETTSATSIFQASHRVRNVSENENRTISIQTPQDVLAQILTLLDAMIDYGDKHDLYTDVAERLSTIARKDPAWGWRYIQSVASGTVEPSKKFAAAVNTLAVSLDGVPVPFAKSSPVTVYAVTGTVQDGAFLMTGSRRCASPSCTVVFVPNVPWRKLCPVCNPKKE